MKRILVLGATGLLGHTICPYLSDMGQKVIRHGLTQDADYQTNLLDSAATANLISATEPDVIINLVAATNVDHAVEHREWAYDLNCTVVRNISEKISGRAIHLIQISTDQVYSGIGPHTEDLCDPINIYGQTKFKGERLAESIGATVLRCNFVGRSRTVRRQSFSDWVVERFSSGEPFTLFDDVLFTPMHMETLAAAIDHVSRIPRSGVFNVGSSAGISKACFGLRLAHELGLVNHRVRICKMASKRMLSPRPKDMRMNTSRFEREFDYRLPTLDETLCQTAKDYVYAK